jgi:hypothetical protein
MTTEAMLHKLTYDNINQEEVINVIVAALKEQYLSEAQKDSTLSKKDRKLRQRIAEDDKRKAIQKAGNLNQQFLNEIR